MDIALIPGLWLDGASWGEVSAPLRAAGHTVHEVTRSGDTLQEQVDSVVALVDSIDGELVLAGHSGGGVIAWAAADARPDRISRVVFVDSGPLAAGGVINDELPAVDGKIGLPDWSVFDDIDLVDLTDDLRDKFRSIAFAEPERVPTDKQVLSNPARFDVPVTLISCEFTPEELKNWVKQGAPQVSELKQITDYEIVHLPTGHWPQFTRPADLAAAIDAAVTR